MPSASTAEVHEALSAAKKAQFDWAHTPAPVRGAFIRGAADLIKNNREALARLVSQEVGKPLEQAFGEIDFAEGFLRYNAEWDRRLEGEILPADSKGETIYLLRVPLGVVAAICPWNFPLAVLCRKLGPALVTGNIRIESIWFLLVDLDTDEGVRGSSFIWGFNKAAARSLAAMVEHLADSALGEDPTATTRLYNKMWRALIQQGHAGVPIMALSAIDAAAWDALGKVAGLPIVDLLGRKLDAVPVYASALWIIDDLDALDAF